MTELRPRQADEMGGDGRATTPAIATASVIVAMALAAVGNGLMFAYIPVKLGADGYGPTLAGLILTGLSIGGIAGCLLTGFMVRRVGHARAFVVCSALIVLSNAAIAAGTYPIVWIAARSLYGFAILSMFIVGQSWLNDVVVNRIRGRVTAIFYVCYIVGMGVGSYLLGYVDLMSAQGPLIGIVFTALSILPVGLTRLRPPPPPVGASVALRQAWRISPVGVAGMLAVGGLSMMVAGFAPIHATASGFSQQEVATLMFAMPLGTLLFQIPLGWISDRTDRRYVLVATSLLVIVAGVVASHLDGGTLTAMVLIYVVWSGATESLYSLSSAHANDRAGKGDLVALSSTLLFCWSLSGFVVLAVATTLTGIFGTQAFMYVAIVLAAAYCLFVIWRVVKANPPPSTTAFAPMTAQAPPPVELAVRGEAERR